MTTVRKGPWVAGSAVENSGGPPHDGGMESRLTKLETLVPTLATKSDVEGVRADLHKMSSEMKGWFIATAVLVLVGMFTIANVMITQVRSSQTSIAAPLAPVVIQVPGTAPPSAPAAMPAPIQAPKQPQ